MKLSKSNKYYLFYPLFLLLLSTNDIYSQPLSIPYFCGFEDVQENAEWKLNLPDGPDYKERWLIGNGARSEGRAGLYISRDSASALYGLNSNTLVAYREFSVPQQMPYDISFDWKNNGVPGISELYVLLLRRGPSPSPIDAMLPSDSTSAYVITGGLNDIVSQRKVRPAAFNNSTQWENFYFEESLRAYPATYALVFVWINKCQDSLPNPVGACIDNIQIASTWCPKPYDLNVQPGCDTTKLVWKGTAPYYEAEYKQKNSYQWRKLGKQTEKNITIPNLPQGMYDFRVRAISTKDTSAYNTVSSVIVFCPGYGNCPNYADFDDSRNEAFYGDFNNPKKYNGFRDFGPDNPLSQHTVNWIQNDFDPRTGGRLRTIPQGSYASVRLGNWLVNRGAESIRYKWVVDSTASILLMQYAVVLDDGGGHDPKVQPQFSLRILDENQQEIDPDCGTAEFYADKKREGWNVYGKDITWKDWTTVGLNLSKYIGRQLTIELTTRDCDYNGHYGYAYFTLDCVSATLATNTCGDATEMSISAPEGFKYKWYNPDHPDSTWYTREIELPALDSTTYYCDVCFVEQDSCCFTLSTKVYPRFPVVDFTYERVTENCRNIIRFKNNSHIMTRYNGKEEHTNQHCDMYLWEFSNGLSSSVLEPELICRNKGDTIDVKLTAFLADCSKDYSAKIIVPPIGETIKNEYHEMCYGEGYPFADGRKLLFEGGIYDDTIPSVCTGCDSITRLELIVHPQYDLPVETDTICFGEFKEFAGREYRESGTHEVWLKSQHDCDSIVTLDLFIRDEITFVCESTDVVSGPNSGEIKIKDISLSTYTYTINGNLNGALTGLPGGVYTIILYNEYNCASEPQEIIIKQDCLEIEMENAPLICGNDSSFEIPYIIGKGYPTTYNVLFSDEAKEAGFSDLISLSADGSPVQIPLPGTVRPDIYEMDIVFEDLLCDSVHNEMSFTVNYPFTIIEQRWNDVMAVVNSTFNGGYNFSAFQWYKNGSILFGENKSYLYTAGSELDFEAEYSVLLTRSDDGKSIFCCSRMPEERPAGISLYPLIVNKEEQATLKVPASALVNIYDSMGRQNKSIYIPADGTIKLDISNKEGYYVVVVQLDGGVKKSFSIIVR